MAFIGSQRAALLGTALSKGAGAPPGYVFIYSPVTGEPMTSPVTGEPLIKAA